MHKTSCLCLMLLLGLGLIGNITPKASAPLIGTNFYEEVTGLPFHPRVVDVDSKGNIFVLSYDQDVWRSTDNGASWAMVLNDNKSWAGVSPTITEYWLTLFVDSQDNIFVNILTVVTVDARVPTGNLYRSIDGGNSWSIVMANSRRSWHMDESSNGTLWYQTFTGYTPSGPPPPAGGAWATVHKSVDHGATWSVFYNFTIESGDLRTTAVNNYNDNEIWAASSQWVKYWNGSAWTTVHYDDRSQSFISSIWFDSKYVYLGAEYLGGKTANWRYPHAPKPNPIADWDNYDYYWDADKLPYVINDHADHGWRINDIMLFGIKSQLWGSWDGTRWVKIVDLGNATASNIGSVSQRRPIYFIDKKVGKLYRLYITKEDLIQLYYGEFLKYRGNSVNQENYIAEYRIANGTNEVDLTNVALNNVQASIKGLTRKNYFNNSGFETGTTREWLIYGQGAYSVVSTDKYEGTYTLRITKNALDTYDRYFWQNYIPVSRGTILTLSAWVKANTTLTEQVILGFRNQTSGTWAYYPGSATGVKAFNVTTSWTRVKLYFALNVPDVNLRAEFSALKGATYELFVDALQLEKREVEIIRQEPNNNIESIEHLQYQPWPYFADKLNTADPILLIAGQTVSHSGTLTNGTESIPQNLTGIHTGAVRVEANIRGSGQAILRLTGTRVLYEDSIILQGRKDNVYYGRYYGTFSPTTTTTDLIAVTNIQANITSLSVTTNTLALIIDSSSGTNSTTKVYVSDKGQPKNVTGATSWSYDSSTKILDITALHSSSTTILIRWRLLGDANDDGTVNATDLSYLNEAFGGTGGPPPSPNWNPNADLNQDNNINLIDLYIIGKNYGKSV